MGKVEYRHVDFAYNFDQPVLKDLCLDASPGDVIALVGSSGAGKSTLINLLLRFYDPQRGQILVDDIDIRDVTLTSLRHQIGIVPQMSHSPACAIKLALFPKSHTHQLAPSNWHCSPRCYPFFGNDR